MTDFSHINRTARNAPVSDGRRMMMFRKLLAKRTPGGWSPGFEALRRRQGETAVAESRLKRFLDIERRDN